MKVSPLLAEFSMQIALQSSNFLLGKSSLKHSRLQQIETNLSHACFHLLLSALDYNFIPIKSGQSTFSLYGCNMRIFLFFE